MLYFAVFAFLLFLPLAAQAVPICVICTAAVGAGVGLSRWLGIDDAISGLWIGGLIISLVIWTINWLDRKNIRFFGRKPLIAAAFYLTIIWPLYYYNIIGHPLNKLWGIDRLLLGVIAGTIGFAAALKLNENLKKRNGGKSYFPFQKVVVPVGLLALLGLAFYLIGALR